MGNTKNDLSYNKAILDLDSINTTAVWATQILADKIREKSCNITYARNIDGGCVIDAEEIARLSGVLAIATELAHTANKAKDRDYVSVKGKLCEYCDKDL
jgi:hypothetical protein